MLFKLHADYEPTGDQPQAIEKLVRSIQDGNRDQTLLGVTGSGKTFTMANVIARCDRPCVAHWPAGLTMPRGFCWVTANCGRH